MTPSPTTTSLKGKGKMMSQSAHQLPTDGRTNNVTLDDVNMGTDVAIDSVDVAIDGADVKIGGDRRRLSGRTRRKHLVLL